MSTNRALGLLAALLVTAGQALVFAVDTSAATQAAQDPIRHQTILGAENVADAQRAYGESRGLTGG
jgi:hypothetical protein